MEGKKVYFTLGASAGPGVPVKSKEEKKPAEIVPAKPAVLATVPAKSPEKPKAEKKTATKKAVAKVATEKKTAAKKTAAKPAAEKKTTAKSVRKPAAKKAAGKTSLTDEIKAIADAKKPAAKKPGRPRKTEAAAAKTTAVKTNIVLQYGDANITSDSIVEGARKAWAADGGKGAVKNLDVYVKPEEGKAYYVVNKDNTGSFDL